MSRAVINGKNESFLCLQVTFRCVCVTSSVGTGSSPKAQASGTSTKPARRRCGGPHVLVYRSSFCHLPWSHPNSRSEKLPLKAEPGMRSLFQAARAGTRLPGDRWPECWAGGGPVPDVRTQRLVRSLRENSPILSHRPGSPEDGRVTLLPHPPLGMPHRGDSGSNGNKIYIIFASQIGKRHYQLSLS